jgi:hypothetical protein
MGADGYLRASTAGTVLIGPFLDKTDGITAETTMTIAQANVRLSKNGGAEAQKNESTTATHDENGWYRCPYNTTDVNTPGRLKLAVTGMGTSLPVWHTWTVLPKFRYDTFVGGTTYSGTLHATQAGGTVVKLSEAESAEDDIFNGQFISIYQGSAWRQIRRIIDYVGSTNLAHVDAAWDITPVSGDKYAIGGAL